MLSVYSELRKEYLNEWRIWYRMIQRCERQEKYYVSVEVDPSFLGESGFVNWFDEIGPRPGNYQMKRHNIFGNYEPGNIYWAPRKEIMNDMRCHNDPSEMGYWKNRALENGIRANTFYSRVRDRGWRYEDAATLTPSQERYKNRIV